MLFRSDHVRHLRGITGELTHEYLLRAILIQQQMPGRYLLDTPTGQVSQLVEIEPYVAAYGEVFGLKPAFGVYLCQNKDTSRQEIFHAWLEIETRKQKVLLDIMPQQFLGPVALIAPRFQYVPWSESRAHKRLRVFPNFEIKKRRLAKLLTEIAYEQQLFVKEKTKAHA
jgi:hypothetical protein